MLLMLGEKINRKPVDGHLTQPLVSPQIFYPETTDIYDRKNMPRCIYCIHALR